jgi:hypothetical protein
MKGQLTVEFLIILAAMLLIFSAVSLDLMTFSLENAFETQNSEYMRAANLTLTASANSIFLQGPGAKKTIYLRAPADCDYVVESTDIVLECRQDSASFERYNNFKFGETPTGVTYSPTGRIESGVSGKIEIVKS